MTEPWGIPTSEQEKAMDAETAAVYIQKLQEKNEQKERTQKLANAILDMTNVLSQMNVQLALVTKNALEANEATHLLQQRVNVLEKTIEELRVKSTHQ